MYRLFSGTQPRMRFASCFSFGSFAKEALGLVQKSQEGFGSEKSGISSCRGILDPSRHHGEWTSHSGLFEILLYR